MGACREEIEGTVLDACEKLEDTCEALGFDERERKHFFDLVWDYSEHAMSLSREEMRRWWS
jgi:hypothetical protein